MRWLQHISVLGALAALTSAIPANEDICSGKDCQKVVKVLSSIQASPFCSEYLNIKTSTRIVTATATSIKTICTTTASVKIPPAATQTSLVSVPDQTTATKIVTVTPAAVTTSVTSFVQTDKTVTETITSTSTICTGRGLVGEEFKRDALPTSPALNSRGNIPKALQSYSYQQLSNACSCYLTSKTPKVVTQTITTTVKQVQTKTRVISVTKRASTVVVTVTTHYPITVTTITSTQTLDPQILTNTVTSTDITSTETTTEVVPTTTSNSYDYKSVLNSQDCVTIAETIFRHEDYYDVSSVEEIAQRCACLCNTERRCISFFIFEQHPTSSHPVYYSCYLDEEVYNSKTTFCGGNNVGWSQAYSLLECADELGPYIAVFKTHIDIVHDFGERTVCGLKQLAAKHDFLIFEDRKFVDIGSTAQKQYHGGALRISEWADIVNVSVLGGDGVVEALEQVISDTSFTYRGERALLLLAEMTTAGSLAIGQYTQRCVDIARKGKGGAVIGFVATQSLSGTELDSTKPVSAEEDFVVFTTGVNRSQTGNVLGQQYQTPEAAIRGGSDFIIAGRGIYASENRVQTARQYQAEGWAAYETRIMM